VKKEVSDGALLWCKSQFFCSQSSGLNLDPLHVKQNDKHALHLSWLFRSRWVWTFSFKHPCTVHAVFPKHLSDHCQGLHHTFPNLHNIWFTLTVPLSDPLQHHIRPNTRLQIKGQNKSACPPRCVTFCTLIPKIC
jgi:hypothetical protein